MNSHKSPGPGNGKLSKSNFRSRGSSWMSQSLPHEWEILLLRNSMTFWKALFWFPWWVWICQRHCRVVVEASPSVDLLRPRFNPHFTTFSHCVFTLPKVGVDWNNILRHLAQCLRQQIPKQQLLLLLWRKMPRNVKGFREGLFKVSASECCEHNKVNKCLFNLSTIIIESKF